MTHRILISAYCQIEENTIVLKSLPHVARKCYMIEGKKCKLYPNQLNMKIENHSINVSIIFEI